MTRQPPIPEPRCALCAGREGERGGHLVQRPYTKYPIHDTCAADLARYGAD